MKKEFELVDPPMPDFVYFKQEPGLRQDSFKPNPGYDIANFSLKEAEEYAELMSKCFMEHWQIRVDQKKQPKPQMRQQ